MPANSLTGACVRPIVAVTGATGFIGRMVRQMLRRSGWRVRILVRDLSRFDRVDGEMDPVHGSLEDSASLHRLLRGAYAIVHCAGAVRGATRDQFEHVNVEGVIRLVSVAHHQPFPPRLLLLSSLAARVPTLSPYAASKRRGEEVLTTMARDIPWTIFRPPAVYGPGDKELLPLFRLMGRGFAPIPGVKNARFSMLFVEDLATAVVQWLESDRCAGSVYTLHDGRSGGYGWLDVVNTVASICNRPVRSAYVPTTLLQIPAALNSLAAYLFGYKPMLTPGKLRELRHTDWVCDNDGIIATTGWAPKILLEEGLCRTSGWRK